MEPKLIKGLQADYVPAIWRGRNTSGFVSFGKNVVVQIDECSDVSAGGVMLTEDMVERMTMNATTGLLVYVGAEAFLHFDDGTRWVGQKPQRGARVYFEKHAGNIQRGIDGKDYRIMDYRCLQGTVDMSNPAVREALVGMDQSREAEVEEAEAAGAVVPRAELEQAGA